MTTKQYLDYEGLETLVNNIRNVFNKKSDIGHTHSSSDITDLQDTVKAIKVTSATSADTADAVAWSKVSDKPTSFTPSSHNQASNTITAMTGYSKASTDTAIAATDSLNTAIGKLEKALDSKQSSGSYLTAHPTISKTDDTTTTPTKLAHSGTFTAVTEVTRDSNGHVTTLNTATYTLPASGNTDTKVASSNKPATKLFLIGVMTQSTSGQTGYSNEKIYIGTDNCLYVTNDAGTGSAKVLTAHQDISGKANLSGATFTGDVTVPKLITSTGLVIY